MNQRLEEDAKIFKALSDAKRLRILELLQDGEKCACVLLAEMDMGQSGLSYHMKILCESGIVSATQAGKWTHYSLNSSGSAYALKRLAAITASKGEDTCHTPSCYKSSAAH